MADENQNPGRKWRQMENDGDGDKFFNNYRYTPYTTDLEFFKDPVIHETDVVKSTQDGKTLSMPDDEVGQHGDRPTDKRIKEQ
jgi:hypothetical protein